MKDASIEVDIVGDRRGSIDDAARCEVGGKVEEGQRRWTKARQVMGLRVSRGSKGKESMKGVTYIQAQS